MHVCTEASVILTPVTCFNFAAWSSIQIAALAPDLQSALVATQNAIIHLRDSLQLASGTESRPRRESREVRRQQTAFQLLTKAQTQA